MKRKKQGNKTKQIHTKQYINSYMQKLIYVCIYVCMYVYV